MTQPLELMQPETTAGVLTENHTDNRHSLTDTGNGLIFVDLFKDLVRYIPAKDLWYIWDGVKWAEDTKTRTTMLALTQEVLRQRVSNTPPETEDGVRARYLAVVTGMENISRRKAMVDTAALDSRVWAKEDDFDAVSWQLVTPSGVIDLRDGSVAPNKSSDMNSRCCLVDYEPDATSPLLDKFLMTFLPNENDQRFVWSVLGHALFAGNKHRIMPVIWGETTSGKSQLFAALDKVLDGYVSAVGASIFRGSLDDRPRSDLEAAMFTRIAVASEGSEAWSLHADQVKRITGGDPLPYRPLYKGMITKTPRFTPMIVTNAFPKIIGADKATARRIMVIHFDKSLTPGEEDPNIKEEFLSDVNCLKAILARLVAGARDDTILIDPPEKYMIATMQARTSMDHISEFLEWLQDENILVETKAPAYECLPTSSLFTIYKYWLKNMGDKVDKDHAFKIKKFTQVVRDVHGWAYSRSSGSFWVGWQLNSKIPPMLRLSLGV